MPRAEVLTPEWSSADQGISIQPCICVPGTRAKIGAVPQGFRSSFRDWTAESTAYHREVAEAALAHTIRDEVEAARRCCDLFNKRRKLMAAWAAFLGCATAETADVVPVDALTKARRRS